MKCKTVGLILLFASYGLCAQGLKKVDYQAQTTEQKSSPNQLAGAESLSPEQTAELMKNIEKIKANQETARKYLEELDKDE